MTGPGSEHIAGGPAQHAGNMFHYVYAATRVMELLQQDSGVDSVRLEGFGSGGVAEDALDVVVERDNSIEFVQVKWSSGQALQPAQCWGIVKDLWSSAQYYSSLGHRIEITLFTNRSAGPTLRDQLDLLEQWKSLSDQELRAVLENESPTDATRQALLSALGQVTGNTQTDSISALVSTLNIEYGLGPARSDQDQRLLDAQLRGLHLIPDSKRPLVLGLIMEHCLPGKAGHPITAELLLTRLGLTLGPGIAHDIHPPEGYVPWDTLGSGLDQTIQSLAASGGVIAVLGGPGSGKTVQLGLWAREKNYPLYACRLDRYDEIPMRADQSTFTNEINRVLRSRYHDRISLASMASMPGADRGERFRSLRQLLDALGAGSTELDPAVLVIDGLDDAVRGDSFNSFLNLLQIPPNRVVLVVSAQGSQFLPEAMRTTSSIVRHIDMPSLPDEIGVAISRSLLGPSAVANSGQGQVVSAEFQQVVEGVVRLAGGNPLVLSTLCHRLLQDSANNWSTILDDTGQAAFTGIEDYFAKILGSPGADDLRCLKTLATARIPIPVQWISAVTNRAIEDIQPSLARLRYLLATTPTTPQRYSLYHPSLRRYVEQNLFNGDQSAAHLALAELYESESGNVDLAAERAYHLMEGGRPEKVLDLVTYEHIDHLFAEFLAPSRVREQVVLLARAASRSGKLTEALRAALMATKVHQRIDLVMPPGAETLGGSDLEAAALITVLLRTGDAELQNRAIGLLREIDDPVRRHRMAIQTGLESFRRGAASQAYSILAIAKETSLFHDTPRDLEAALDTVRMEAWTGKPLRDICRTTCSTTWIRQSQDNAEPPARLPKRKQYELRGKTLRAFASEAVRSGREDELRQVIADAPRVYKVALILGMVEEENPPNGPEVKSLVQEAKRASHLDSGAKRDIATLSALVLGDRDSSAELVRRRRQTPPPDLLGRMLPDSREPINSFKEELLFKMRMGEEPHLSFDHIEHKDLREAARFFYDGLVALYSAKILAEGSGQRSEVADRLASVCEVWAQERPYSMWWTPFIDARRELRLHAPDLVSLAFGVDAATGVAIGDRIWGLSGWAIGALDLESKLHVIHGLRSLPTAHDWAKGRLTDCVDSIASTVRNTDERVSLLLKCSLVASSLGQTGKSVDLAREAVKSSKGLPSVDEEPRYYAALEFADAMHTRTIGSTAALRRIGRCIDASYEATSRTYAGHTWPWLLDILSKVDLPTALSVAAELDDDPGDEFSPSIITSLQSILLNGSSNLTPPQWTALLWIARTPPDEEKVSTLLTTARESLTRCTSNTTKHQLGTWISYILRQSGRFIASSTSLSKEQATGDGDPLEHEALALAVAQDTNVNGDLLRRAVNGDPHAGREVLHQLEVQGTGDRSGDEGTELSLDFDRERRLRSLLERIAVVCYPDDLGTVRRLYAAAGRPYGSRLELSIARREASQNPSQAADRIVNALNDTWWSDPSTAVEGLRLLAEIDRDRAYQELVDAVALRKRPFTMYWMARVLVELPDTLVADSELTEIFDLLCTDIEDSLATLPVRPTRTTLTEGSMPHIRDAKELVRHLLHNRDRDVRTYSLQSVGILATEDIDELVELFHSREGLEALPWHLRLTAEQQRLAALWSLAELRPQAFVSLAADIFGRYLAQAAPCGKHYLMREYARQICARLLDADGGALPAAGQDVVRTILPRRLSDLDSEYSPGQRPIFPLGVLDRQFEYEIEHLARLFRVPNTRVIETLRRIIKRMPNLTPEDHDIDDWVERQRYAPNSRPLIKAREEVARHAYRILQGRWCLNRVADGAYLQREGVSYLERREFDPWLPSLFVHEADLPFGPPTDDRSLGAEWFDAALPDLTDHILRDDLIIVHEDVTSGVREWRVMSWIESCVIPPTLQASWLAADSALEAAHADFPSWIYVREVNEDHSGWWSRWSYGSLDASYAADHLAIEEPFYVKVSSPLPRFSPQLKLDRQAWGYQFVNAETGAIIWVNTCPDNNEGRAFASRQWLTDTLGASNLLWAFDVRVLKERREKTRWGYAPVEERMWTIRAVLDQAGQIRWGSPMQTHREFDRRDIG